jgi:hypothetical protein
VSLTKAIEFARSFADLAQRLFERIGFIAVCAQQRVDDALKKASSCAVGMKNADGRYRYWEGSVVVNLYKPSV